mmetsp:Transcript_186/g.477  ORF Transcript_186/g.477 Transcript_186/m.477 type:complete len:321 (-) Transcript_186:248-1210(-)
MPNHDDDEPVNAADLVTQVRRDDDPGAAPPAGAPRPAAAESQDAKKRPLFSRLCRCFGGPEAPPQPVAVSTPAAKPPPPPKGAPPAPPSGGGGASAPSGGPAPAADNGQPVMVTPKVPQRGGAAKMTALLPPQEERFKGRKLLILDLDETLVHSSFRPIDKPDISLSIEMNGQTLHVFVAERPGVHDFLEKVAQTYEVVVWTASLAKYADPLMDILDPKGFITGRLFRPHCTKYNGVYVKDLSLIGRSMDDVLIIDNSPLAYSFHVDNAIPIKSWYDDPTDRELWHLMPILSGLAQVESIPAVLRSTRAELDGQVDDDGR